MSLKPGRAEPYPQPPAEEGRLSFMRIQMDPPAAAATREDADRPGEVRRSFVTGPLSVEIGPSDRLLPGLPPGAAGLPGRQIPPRAERADGLAAGRHPDPTVDVPIGPTLPGTHGDAPVGVLQAAKADPRTQRGAEPEEREWVTC